MLKRTTLSVLTLVLILSALVLAACTSPTDDPTENPSEPNPSEPALPLENQLTGEWQLYDGAEGTICANGAPYSHYAYKGSTNNLVIDFQGGGACWDGATCSQGSSTAAQDALYTDTVIFYDTDDLPGIYDHTREDNPVEDWYHVYIPYCTGDIHIGNAEQAYTAPDGTDFTVQHKGAVNAGSVLDWTFENFEAPEQIFVTGCSAGGYGAAYWTETIAANYPDADIKQLGDCAAGVATDAFSALLSDSWDTSATFPELTFDADVVDEAYTDALASYPGLQMAQYNTVFDETQVAFYALGADKLDDPNVGLEWSQIMQQSLNEIDALSSEFAYYISDLDEDTDPLNGTQHCIITRDAFYEDEVNSVKFVDWLDDYLSGEPVENVTVDLSTTNP